MKLKYFAALLLLLLAFWWYLSPMLHSLPKPTGTYEVGIKSYEFSDFTIQCWYPTDSSTQYKCAPYGQPKQNLLKISQIAQASNAPEALLKNSFNFTTHSKLEAPLSSKNSTYPVIVFLPGLACSYDYYEALLSGLASHGYIVIAINTSPVQPIEFCNGRFILPQPTDDLTDMIPLAAANFSTTVNWLMQQNTDQQSIWFGHIDLKNLCVMGHSFGGSSAVVIAQQNQSIAAGINLDGWLEMKPIKAIPVPFLFLLNDTNFPPGKQDGMKEIEQTCALSGPQCNVKIIPGAGHNSFFDFAFLKWPLNKIGDPGTKDPYKILQNIENEILKFLKSVKLK